jgi:hypothetical protein
MMPKSFNIIEMHHSRKSEVLQNTAREWLIVYYWIGVGYVWVQAVESRYLIN